MGGNKSKSFTPKHAVSKKNQSAGNTFVCNKDSASPSKSDEEIIEDVVCKESEIGENEMKLLPLGSEGGKILLIKQNGELSAIGTKCTHYGALLNTGALGEGRVRCPWHGACFNIKTGDIEDYPGLNSLPCYKVTVADGQVKVRAKKDELLANSRMKGMCKSKAGSPFTTVIVGGGPSGAVCAETLRQEGFEGRIVLVCKELVLPYDRVKVSKNIDLDVQNHLLRSQKFYDDNNIETKLGIEATCLDVKNQTITLSNEECIQYDNLYIATGSSARKLNIPGSDLNNIFLVRNYTDAQAVNSQLGNDKHMVVLGTGFTGMETAAYCIDKCASVTIIGRSSAPFSHVFGEDIGNRIRKEFEDKGAKFISNNSIKTILKKGDQEIVGQVELTDGTILPADILILAVGSTFNTEWLKSSGVKLLDNGSVEVNQYLRTNVPNVYAGGDIAYAPVAFANTSAAIGHYGLAHYHGKIAAMNICKKETPLKTVPYFWTTLFGKSYRYAGFGDSTNIKVHGSLDQPKFFAYHLKNSKVIAMSSVGTDPIVSDFANYLYEDKTVTEEEILKDPVGWMRYKPQLIESKSIINQQQRKYHSLAVKQFSYPKYSNKQVLKYSTLIRNLCKLIL